jgi:hypothetical protein
MGVHYVKGEVRTYPVDYHDLWHIKSLSCDRRSNRHVVVQAKSHTAAFLSVMPGWPHYCNGIADGPIADCLCHSNT